MNKQLGFAILLLAALMLVPAHAVRKRNEQQTPTAAGTYVPPSTKLEPFLEPCLDAILAPLEANPKLPRVEVEKLRSSFAGGQIKAKTAAQQQIFQNAMAVCDALNKAMDDRANARSAAQASSKVPMRSDATGIIKSSPMRGFDAGANAEAIRKKQKDERKDADDVARRNVAYMDSAAYRSWTEKAPRLRQGVMALYTRQIQLEALDEKNAEVVAAAQAANGAPVVTARPAEKSSPAQQGSYAGTWAFTSGSITFLIKDDHTAIKTKRDGEKANGTWTVEDDGDFHVKWEDHLHFKGKLSEDGQSIRSSLEDNKLLVRKP